MRCILIKKIVINLENEAYNSITLYPWTSYLRMLYSLIIYNYIFINLKLTVASKF